MTYRNGLVACIMQDSRPVRETNGVCILPFGSEYEILLKNKTASRARADIFIDGAKANSNSYVIDGNSQVTIKRFNLDGNQDSGGAFQFVKKADAVGEIDLDNKDVGVVEIRFHQEAAPYITYFTNVEPLFSYNPCSETEFTRSITCALGGEQTFSSSVQQDGATVQGKTVEQGFTTTSWAGDRAGTATVIRIRLKGPRTPEDYGFRGFCSMCGAVTQKNWKFCTSCGEKLSS